MSLRFILCVMGAGSVHREGPGRLRLSVVQQSGRGRADAEGAVPGTHAAGRPAGGRLRRLHDPGHLLPAERHRHAEGDGPEGPQSSGPKELHGEAIPELQGIRRSDPAAVPPERKTP